MLNDFKATFGVYVKFVAVLLPLLLLTSVLIIIDHIPYLNLFKETIAIIILSIDWFMFVFLSKIKPRAMIKVALVLLISTFFLFQIKLHWYAESMSNLAYIILCTAMILELIAYTKEAWSSLKKIS